MTSASIFGFVATITALLVFLGVSLRQLVRVRQVASGEVTVGGRGPRDTGSDGD